MEKDELAYKVIGCAMQEQAKIQSSAKFCKFMNSVNSDSDNYLGNRENGFILLIFNEIRCSRIADPYNNEDAGWHIPLTKQHRFEVYPEGRGYYQPNTIHLKSTAVFGGTIFWKELKGKAIIRGK